MSLNPVRSPRQAPEFGEPAAIHQKSVNHTMLAQRLAMLSRGRLSDTVYPATGVLRTNSMGMTLQQIDEALAGWNRRLTAMADNLMSLQSESTYRALTGSGGATKVQITGQTAARVEPALAAIRVIFEQFGVLHATIERASKLREGLPSLFGGDEKIAEIYQLLFGRSVEPPAVDVPFAQRTLLSGAPNPQRLTLEELLAPMTRAFVQARDSVLAVDRAWQEIAVRVAQAEEQIQRLDARTQAAGCGRGSAAALALASTSAVLAQSNEQLRVDPLGAMTHLQFQVEPSFARLRNLVEAVEHAHRELQRAHDVLADLTAVHRDALGAAVEAKAKIAPSKALPQPVAEEKLTRLRDWLGQLDRRWSEGAQETATAGLRNWHDAACVLGKEDTAARDRNRAALEVRRELRGRLEALKAKARSIGVAEQPSIAAIANEADSVLANKPTDMERAAAGVAAYSGAVNGARKGT